MDEKKVSGMIRETEEELINTQTFAQKVSDIQTRLNAPKSQYNSFGKYSYRNAEDILGAVKPLLKEYGMFLCVSDDIVMIGNRYYVKATATLSDGKLEHEVTAYAREPESKKGMDEAQVTGATSSYARKYALNGLFAIDDIKDADSYDNRSNAPSGAPQRTQAEPQNSRMAKIAEMQREAVSRFGAQQGGSVYKEMLVYFGVDKTEQLKDSDLEEAHKWIKEYKFD